jgi:gamma-glutamyltranspeptidase / glutathione hydrolase
MRLGFADRAEHFGDPDFVSVPTEKLTSPAYLDSRWQSFDASSAKSEIKAGSAGDENQKSSTTHFSVIDRMGNAVALTTTINVFFGSGFVAPGTGVLMNNEMDDFSAQSGAANVFGLVAGQKNAVGPAKRPLSSMSPTIIRDEAGNSRVVIGALGGPRIITSVFLALVNRYQFGMALSDAVIAPRFHHQWRPDRLVLERNGFAREVRESLTKLGYPVAGMESSGKISALERFPNGRVSERPGLGST